MQLPQAQQFLLQQQSQISPTTAATTPSQYPAFVDYNSLLQPPAGKYNYAIHSSPISVHL